MSPNPPAAPPPDDPIQLVRDGYNRAAASYSAQRDTFQNIRFLEKLLPLLSPGAAILDIGCGAGIPIDQYLVSHGFQITGLDISESQIELARKNIPQGTYSVADMSLLEENQFSVAAIVSFYAIFHTPRETHPRLFQHFASYLPTGGILLITMGAGAWVGIEDDFHGVPMYWSHYGPQTNTQMVQNAGFEILLDEIDSGGDEKHQVIMGRKI